jgi:alkylation response protein AidB-like acyl-CoA dehydrogenase
MGPAAGGGDGAVVQRRIEAIAAEWAGQRAERQRRRGLERADFDRLRDAGYLRASLPVQQGGLWEGVPRSTRAVCELLRVMAGGDASVALVSAMHPAVLSFWLATPRVPEPFQDAWEAQQERVCQAVGEGAWWGTITSEPGSGGDVARTRAVAREVGGAGDAERARYRLSGHKHFGSGSGITSYVLTSARPASGGGASGAGEEGPDWFFLDLRNAPWDGSTGMRLLAEWDGHGMAATQSHGFAFEDFPAERFAWPGHLADLQGAAGPFVGCCFTAVIVGVTETALATAREQLGPRRESLRAYEGVEWTRAVTEGWLIRQAYEGMLRAVEAGAPDGGLGAVLRGKTAVAELAESVLSRLCRVMGGGTFARGSPFGYWFEDVRALGFLRPPWGLAHDRLFDLSWEQGTS